MSDLKKEAASLHGAASGSLGVGHHTAKPSRQSEAQSDDLGALGSCGSLLSATGETGEGMTKLTGQLTEEWEAEAKLIGEVSDAFDLLDVLLAAAARPAKD
ncbi:hypothetical protein ABZT03_36970 [Streptomyces sp. NPDC005574]|uniref:hypothetical protein n=1 Tax=Streptomyces sp. NPDC005574 TaxID=3156891 RepID=UPI0033BEF3B1